MKKLIIITTLILSSLIILITGTSLGWINDIFNNDKENEDEYIEMVREFVINAPDDKDEACKSSYEYFYDQNDVALNCKSIGENDNYSAKIWYYNEINIIDISKNTRDIYISSSEARKEYYKIEVSYKVDESDVIRSTNFYAFDIDDETYFTLTYPKSDWFK